MIETSTQLNIERGGMAGDNVLAAQCGMLRKGPRAVRRPTAPPAYRRNHLRAWRIVRDMTIEELAEKSGISTGMVSSIENGRAGYSDESLAKLAHALAVPAGYILSVDPNAAADIWPVWDRAKPDEREQIVAIAKALIKSKV